MLRHEGLSMGWVELHLMLLLHHLLLYQHFMLLSE